jgi:thiosulfate/3-mercaptopyruvate sulfurtransferase
VHSLLSSFAIRAGLIAITTALPLGAQRVDPPRDLVVSPKWLAMHLRLPNLLLLHVGPADKFDQKHIAGAHFVELDAISLSDHAGKGLMLEMPSPEALRSDLEALGISDSSQVVVYNTDEWFTPSTRVVFTLDYAGLGNRVHYLDGGIEAWVRDGNPVVSDKTPITPGHLSPLKTRPLIVDADYVHAHLNTPHVAIVDARSASIYDGVDVPRGHDGPQRRGHIAGAHSVPFTEITDDQIVLKTPDQLRALFAKAGVQPGDTVVAYCHVGQQATGVILGARLAGFPVRLYDGSFEDWSRRTEYPVEAPPARGKP